MFGNLTERLGGAMQGLFGKGVLTEEAVNQALREVRIALLEADVALPVAKDFIDHVRAEAVGEKVLKAVKPGEQVVKIVHDALMLWIAARQLRRIHIPTGADFTETMRHTPLLVVLGVDLLDLSLDFLSAPIAWVILDRLGLKALRGISVVQAAVPGTQILPLMTLTWIAVRLFVPGDKTID